MNCEILETLYIKSNGTIVCNDDAGESVCLGKVDNSWSPNELFSTIITHIKSEFSKGKVPWPGVCENCAFLKLDGFSLVPESQRVIKKLQVESALACNLKCPGCCNKEQIKYSKKPLVMTLGLYSLALNALSREGYKIQEIEYCGQGDPLMNQQISDFIDISRKLFPEAFQRVITNGNFDYKKSLGGSYIDQVIVSCDGIYQDGYEKYRIGGRVDKVIKFMTDACALDMHIRPEVIWKYILFEFNDSLDEISSAQHMANEIGVDTMMFVYTHSKFHSTKYQKSNYVDLPRLYGNVITNFTPIIGNRSVYTVQPCNYKNNNKEVGFSKKVFGLNRQEDRWLILTLDEVAIVDESHLNIRGWLLCQQDIQSVKVSANGCFLGNAAMDLPRLDVYKEYPDFNNKRSGFTVSGILDELNIEKLEVIFNILFKDGGVDTRRYNLSLPKYDTTYAANNGN